MASILKKKKKSFIKLDTHLDLQYSMAPGSSTLSQVRTPLPFVSTGTNTFSGKVKCKHAVMAAPSHKKGWRGGKQLEQLA